MTPVKVIKTERTVEMTDRSIHRNPDITFAFIMLSVLTGSVKVRYPSEVYRFLYYRITRKPRVTIFAAMMPI